MTEAAVNLGRPHHDEEQFLDIELGGEEEHADNGVANDNEMPAPEEFDFHLDEGRYSIDAGEESHDTVEAGVNRFSYTALDDDAGASGGMPGTGLGAPQNDVAVSEIGYEEYEYEYPNPHQSGNPESGPATALGASEEMASQANDDDEIGYEGEDNVADEDNLEGEENAEGEDATAMDDSSTSQSVDSDDTSVPEENMDLWTMQVEGDDEQNRGFVMHITVPVIHVDDQLHDTSDDSNEGSTTQHTNGESSIANRAAPPVPAVRVLYRQVEYELCAREDNDDPETYFFASDEELDYPLSRFLVCIRDVIYSEISPTDELVLKFDDLRLEFGENSSQLFLENTTFRQILSLYHQLHQNDGGTDHEAPIVKLFARTDCLQRFVMLTRHADSGRGFHDFDNSELSDEVYLNRDPAAIEQTEGGDQDPLEDGDSGDQVLEDGGYDDGPVEGALEGAGNEVTHSGTAGAVEDFVDEPVLDYEEPLEVEPYPHVSRPDVEDGNEEDGNDDYDDLEAFGNEPDFANHGVEPGQGDSNPEEDDDDGLSLEIHGNVDQPDPAESESNIELDASREDAEGANKSGVSVEFGEGGQGGGSAVEPTDSSANGLQVHPDPGPQMNEGLEERDQDEFGQGGSDYDKQSADLNDVEGIYMHEEITSTEQAVPESLNKVTHSHQTSATSTLNGDEIGYEEDGAGEEGLGEEGAGEGDFEFESHEAGDASEHILDEIDWDDGDESSAEGQYATNPMPSSISTKRSRQLDDPTSPTDDSADVKRRRL